MDKEQAGNEEAFIEGIIQKLWEEWIDGLEAKEPDTEHEAATRFAKAAGAREDSPLVFMYRSFRAGIGKGLELAERLGK